ncbi:putative secreted protein (Por secretion system target) [Taibaiella chishuiensis]|uniref:Putative secreted protein (Por secretion system target) n=2 Tax=Taibaiella chishuiensis TaxID=1434707 RepID=A0A2P8D1T3_9BACT|nr:putative secreted protein (Por secretion system target) [Taibaiella chishuiensis]
MLATLALVLLGPAATQAADNYWSRFEGKEAPSRSPMTVKPKDYRVFALDQARMQSFLNSLPANDQQARALTLPTPGNGFRTFRVWETPVMEPELARQFPEIRTYTAVAEDDPNVTAKIDYTLYGFRAMVYDGSQSFFIDPYSRDADGFYLAFYTDKITQSFQGNCGLNTDLPAPDNGARTTVNEGNDFQNLKKTNGSQRRTFRLALSCTGEYAISVTGVATPTVTQTMNIIVSTVNRMNGVYEREVSESFKLVANNQNIVYVNPATDPFSTAEANSNQSLLNRGGNIDTVIGVQNYDIGHTLSTVGGGIAQLNTLCAASNKGFSASGSGGPDDIIAITHELAHQHSAKHTFQSKGGQCGGQQSEQDGYEPGGGGTLMAYANVCTGDVVQEGQSLYWHVNSLRQITTYVATIPTCGSTVTGNAPVTVPAVSSTPLFIPKETPIELTAPLATIAGTAQITYCWEQYDIGNAGGKEAENGDATEGPSLRSFYPDTSRSLSHPPVSTIINNMYEEPGERLPKKVRDLNFKLTVRSLNQGWGTFNTTDNSLVLKVDANASKFRVTSQADPETWEPGQTKTIRWDVGGTDGDSVRCKWVNIYLSRDNGKSFPYLLVANAPNNGSYNVTVPNVYAEQARVKVKGSGNVFFDVNKGVIKLNGDPTGIKDQDNEDIAAVYPNPATRQVFVRTKTPNATFRVVLFNILGQQISKGDYKGEFTLDVAHLPRGAYFLSLTDNNTAKQSVKKIVLQ